MCSNTIRSLPINPVRIFILLEVNSSNPALREIMPIRAAVLFCESFLGLEGLSQELEDLVPIAKHLCLESPLFFAVVVDDSFIFQDLAYHPKRMWCVQLGRLAGRLRECHA
jgi:hypothetical protein